jgi:hypothetical protein
MRLSEILDQDSYSYQLAIIYTGAGNQEELMRKYDRCVEKLRFQVDPI